MRMDEPEIRRPESFPDKWIKFRITVTVWFSGADWKREITKHLACALVAHRVWRCHHAGSATLCHEPSHIILHCQRDSVENWRVTVVEYAVKPRLQVSVVTGRCVRWMFHVFSLFNNKTQNYKKMLIHKLSTLLANPSATKITLQISDFMLQFC